jgi:PBP1b-binding outer membrane lipoprotein LpoB
MPRQTNFQLSALCALSIAVLGGCASAPPADSGRAVTYTDVRSQGIVAGVGVESQDIVGVTDQMVRDILSNPSVVQLGHPPRVIMDSSQFENASGQRIDVNLLTDRLRIQLQRASAGRLIFVSRESAARVAQERALKREGVTDTGTTGLAKGPAGADFFLRGRLTGSDARSTRSGAVERYTMISFELIDAETKVSVWADLYEFRKGGIDDAVYR